MHSPLGPTTTAYILQSQIAWHLSPQRPRIQGTWVRFRTKLICPSRACYVSETINLAEQRPSMKLAAPIASRDPHLDAPIDALLAARHADPFALLGPHPTDGNWAVRFFLPWAAAASICLRPPAVEGATILPAKVTGGRAQTDGRSEEHTSELQSLKQLVWPLSLVKKNK